MADPGIAEPAPIPAGFKAYQQLQAAGTPQEEITAWQQRTNDKLVGAGVPAEEIDKYWGSAKPQSAMLDSHMQANLGAVSSANAQAVADDPYEMIKSGWNMSDLGLLINRGDPRQQVKATSTFGKILQGSTTFAGDLPATAAGFMLGAVGGAAVGTAAAPGPGTAIGTAVGSVAGAAALPAAMREILMDSYKSGTVHTWQDFAAMATHSLSETGKAALAGEAMLAAAPIAGPLAPIVGNTLARGASVVAAAGAGATVAAVLDGRIPDASDAFAAGFLVLGLHAVGGIPTGVKQVASNLQKIYVNSGVTPAEFVGAVRRDPVFIGDVLGQDVDGNPSHPNITLQLAPPEPKPYGAGEGPTTTKTGEELLPLVQHLEGSADNAVSPAGAIGRYQIMPGTARQYGFDPERMTDPAYAKAAATTILNDLNRRFNGNEADILVAYNAGPGTATKWIAGGRDLASLPAETQRYLENAGVITEGNGVALPPEPPSPPPPPPPVGGEELPRLPGPGEPPVVLNAKSIYDKMDDQIGQPPQPAGLWQTLKDQWRGWVSELAPARGIDDVLVRQGLDRDSQLTLEDRARQTYASDSRTDYFIKHGTLEPGFDADGKPSYVQSSDHSIMGALKMMHEDGGNIDNFSKFMLAGRTIEKAAQGKETGFDLEEMKTIRNDPAEVAKYARAEKEWNHVMDGVLEYGRLSRVFSADQVAAMKRDNMSYISIRRLMGEEAPKPTGRGFKVAPPVKTFEGGDGRIVDPIMATIDNMARIIKMSDRNMFIGSAVELAERGGLAEKIGLRLEDSRTAGATLAEPNSNAFKPYGIDNPEPYTPFLAARANRKNFSPNKFMFIRDGVPEVWSATNPDLALLLRGADSPGQANLVVKLAEKAAVLDRTGIASAPAFMVRTAYRHTLTSYIMDPHSPPPFLTLWRGAMEVYSNSEWVRQWEANGGDHSTLIDMDRHYMHEDPTQLLAETGALDRMPNVFFHPIQAAQWLHEKINMSSGVGYYKYAIQKGLSPLKAATMSRTQKIDFIEKGTLSMAQTWARMVPFTREHMLGLKQVKEAFQDHPGSTTLKLMGTVIGPAVALRLMCWWQDEYGDLKEEDKYKNIIRLERDSSYMFPNIKGFRPRVPAPFGLIGAPLISLTNRMIEHFMIHDPNAFKDWGQTLLASVLPPVLPSIVVPFAERATNMNFFTGKALIPESMRDANGDKISEHLQFTPATSEAAKVFSRNVAPIMETSPIAIDNYINRFLGPVGQSVASALSYPISGPSGPTDWADTSFGKSFLVRNPRMSAQSIQDFYDAKAELDRTKADLAITLKRQRLGMTDTGVAEALAARLPTQQVDGIAKVLAAQNRMIQMINARPDIKDDPKRGMSVDDKRQSLDRLYENSIKLAQVGVKGAQQLQAQAKALR